MYFNVCVITVLNTGSKSSLQPLAAKKSISRVVACDVPNFIVTESSPMHTSRSCLDEGSRTELTHVASSAVEAVTDSPDAGTVTTFSQVTETVSSIVATKKRGRNLLGDDLSASWKPHNNKRQSKRPSRLS